MKEIAGFIFGIWLLVSAYASALFQVIPNYVFYYSAWSFVGYWACLVLGEIE